VEPPLGTEQPEETIRFEGACYAIEGRTLVGPLDFSVRRAETLVVLGESGSGKTTALRLINRLLDPSAGSVLVEDRETTSWDPVRLRRKIGYMIQDIGLLPHLTVSQNVALVPYLEGWESSRSESRVDELLDLVGLPPAEFGRRRPSELSGGQRQRVGVARALAADPPILLCDEAFGAVDPITRRDLQREFKQLVHSLGKTVVFVTHDVLEALAMADRIVLLENGKPSFMGDVSAFRNSNVPAVQALRDLL